MMSKIEVGQHWRHKKRNSIYEIVAIDAAIQVSTIIASATADALERTDWIAYRSIAGGRLCFRMHPEFLDGRFELVPLHDHLGGE